MQTIELSYYSVHRKNTTCLLQVLITNPVNLVILINPLIIKRKSDKLPH